MRRDLDIPHWTVPVPAETESDSNTHSKQVLSVTQQAAPSMACTSTISDAFGTCLSFATAAQGDYRANVAHT